MRVPEYEVVEVETLTVGEFMDFNFFVVGETSFEYSDETKVVTYDRQPTKYKWFYATYRYNIVYIKRK